MWNHIKESDYNTYPDEGEDVLVSDGSVCDVAYYIYSGTYKWLKENKEMDTCDDFNSFVPIKWMKLPK